MSTLPPPNGAVERRNPHHRTPALASACRRMSAAVQFQLVTREGCELCEEMLAELRVFCIGRNASIELLDVDADAELRARYGHRVPVLLLDGEPVCHARFDAAEVGRLLRSAPP
jgi:hypothetical protein